MRYCPALEEQGLDIIVVEHLCQIAKCEIVANSIQRQYPRGVAQFLCDTASTERRISRNPVPRKAAGPGTVSYTHLTLPTTPYV